MKKVVPAILFCLFSLLAYSQTDSLYYFSSRKNSFELSGSINASYRRAKSDVHPGIVTCRNGHDQVRFLPSANLRFLIDLRNNLFLSFGIGWTDMGFSTEKIILNQIGNNPQLLGNMCDVNNAIDPLKGYISNGFTDVRYDYILMGNNWKTAELQYMFTYRFALFNPRIHYRFYNKKRVSLFAAAGPGFMYLLKEGRKFILATQGTMDYPETGTNKEFSDFVDGKYRRYFIAFNAMAGAGIMLSKRLELIFSIDILYLKDDLFLDKQYHEYLYSTGGSFGLKIYTGKL